MYQYKSILVVDDDQDDLYLFQRTVKEIAPHIRVITADNALHGLIQLRTDPAPELILTDLNMPGMDGLQYLEALRHEPRGKSIPCVIWSSKATDDSYRKAMQLGASAFYTKPVDASEIKKTIQQILAIDFSQTNDIGKA